MKKNELIKKIAKELLDNDVLDPNNYSDIESLLNDVEKIIQENLSNYIVIAGTILD